MHLDINECDQNNGKCNQICVNEVGSYHCECKSGYQLDQAGFSCNGKVHDRLWASWLYLTINKISMNVKPVLMGVLIVVTICLDHFTVTATLDMHSIQLITRHAMVLYEPSACMYYHAYAIYDFADINECATYNGACDDFCTNTDGSYTCFCSSGYQLESDGHNCTGTANS